MYHYIYKITLLCGNRKGYYYLGRHSTNDLNDKYAGSGRIVKDYYKMYPKEEGITYIKEILEFNSSKEVNRKREEEIIGNKYATDPLCLNLKAGGDNGFMGGHHSEESKEKVRAAWTTEKRNAQGERAKKALTGTHHSVETKRKIGEGNLGKNKGGNSAKASSVIQYTLEGLFVKKWDSMRDIERDLGIDHSNVCRCCKNIYSEAGGFKWEYAK